MQSARRRRVMPVPDEEERLLQWVYRRSLTTAETDARRIRRINAKQLQLGIEQSEREAARVAKLKRKQDRIVRRLQGYIVISSSDGSDSDGSDVDPPPAADAYSSADAGRAKGR